MEQYWLGVQSYCAYLICLKTILSSTMYQMLTCVVDIESVFANHSIYSNHYLADNCCCCCSLIITDLVEHAVSSYANAVGVLGRAGRKDL